MIKQSDPLLRHPADLNALSPQRARSGSARLDASQWSRWRCGALNLSRSSAEWLAR